MAEIIQSAPIEILTKYFEALPLKSAIKFASCCKTLQNLMGPLVNNKEKQTLGTILSNMIYTLKSFHRDFTSPEAKHGMLSLMLRRLIHTSAIYDVVDNAETLFPNHSKYYDEYNTMFLYVNEEIEMDVKEFNTMLENAQFEYRGFTIIGLPFHQRQRLNNFKNVIETKYFSEPFRIQTYLAYENNAFIEIVFDGEYVDFDFHMRRPSDGQWIFIDQEINRLQKPLSYVSEINRMICFHYLNSEAIKEIVDLLYDLFASSVRGELVKGAEQTNVSIWNDVYEDNAVLAETIHSYMENYNIEAMIHNISHNAISNN